MYVTPISTETLLSSCYLSQTIHAEIMEESEY